VIPVHLSLFQNILWIIGTLLKLVLCALVFYRGVHRRLPLFGTYTALLVVESLAVRWTYQTWGYTSDAARYVYWSALGVVLCARALAVAELCWTSLRIYPAIWSIVRKLLALLTVILLAYASVAAARNSSPAIAFLVTSERSLDFGIAVMLVALLGLGVRYGVSLAETERNIAMGFTVYSTFQMVNDTFMKQWMMKYFHWWVSASVASFEIAMLIWIVPLLRPIVAPPLAPVLLSQDLSASFLGQVVERLRLLAKDLKRVSKSRWK
jgi:hypothetical protein